MTTQRDRARLLRRHMTNAERFVWGQLRGRRFAQFKFRRQVPLGPYVADFVCFERPLIVELDGAQHAEAEQQAHDQRRTRWLEGQGFRVVRLTNDQVMHGWVEAEEVIWRALGADGPSRGGAQSGRAVSPLTPGPSPARGEGRTETAEAARGAGFRLAAAPPPPSRP